MIPARPTMHQTSIGTWKANHHVRSGPQYAILTLVSFPENWFINPLGKHSPGSIELNDRQAQQLQSVVEQKIHTGSIEDISDQLDWIMTSTISKVYSPDAREDHRLSQDPQVQLGQSDVENVCQIQAGKNRHFSEYLCQTAQELAQGKCAKRLAPWNPRNKPLAEAVPGRYRCAKRFQTCCSCSSVEITC